MKKLIVAILSLAMVFSLIACGADGGNGTPSTSGTNNVGDSDTGEDNGNDATANGNPGTEEVTGKTINVAIAHALTDDFTENLRTIQENMAADYGINVTFTNAGGDASAQIANVESMIARNPDVIVLRCIDAETAATLAKMVKDAGIPCVIDETRPNNDDLDYDVNIMGNQSVHGNLTGEYLQAYLDANPDVTLNMLYINGGTSDNIRKRMNGIFETCTSDRLVLIGDENAAFSAATAQEITEAYLTSHPEMNVIGCANDEMALGVIETLKGAGKLDDIMVFGVDGSESGQIAVKAGELTGTTFNDVSIAVDILYQCCVRLANGESVDDMFTDAANKEIDPKAYILLTSENIDTDGTL